MKNIVLASVFAVVFLAGLFAAAHYLRRPTPEAEAASAAQNITPGFVGARQIGVWVLSCADKPRMISAKDGKLSVTLGRCRVNLQLRRKDVPGKVALGVNFRLVGQRLTLVLRTPPFAKKGDELIAEFGRKAVKLAVAGCGSTECIAIAGLPDGVETALFNGRRGAAVFPKGPQGGRRVMSFPLTGLADAISALRRASQATPS